MAFLAVLKEVIEYIGIAVNDEDVAYYLEKELGASSRDALRTELVKQVPGFCIEVLEDDLLIRERCIVIGNLPEFKIFFHQWYPE